MRLALFSIVATLSFLAGCTSGGGGRDLGSDAAGEAAAPDLAAADAVEADPEPIDVPPSLDVVETPDAPTDPGPADFDVGPEANRSCVDGQLPTGAFALLPDEPQSQIHATLAFDGAAVWIAYDVPDPHSSYYDVRLARLWCDGSYATPPARTHAGPLGNDIDPTLAIGPSSALVVWTSDLGTSPVNMFVYARGFGLDGTPLGDAERVLDLTVDGAAVQAFAWMPRVAALPDGTFAVVAQWADPQAARFQVFLAHLAADGSLLPPLGGTVPGLVRIDPSPDVEQRYPDVAARADGSLVVAWTASASATDATVRWLTMAPDGTLSSPSAFAAGYTDGASLAAATGEGAATYAAWFRQDPEGVVELTRLGDAQGAVATFGVPLRADHSPLVVPGPGGGALAWYRTRTGYWSDLLVQGFSAAGAGLAATGQPLVVNPAEGTLQSHAAPAAYGPALTRVRDRVYLAAWSEGTSPDFALMGRFVEVP